MLIPQVINYASACNHMRRIYDLKSSCPGPKKVVLHAQNHHFNFDTHFDLLCRQVLLLQQQRR
jgi:hypothetical protein